MTAQATLLAKPQSRVDQTLDALVEIIIATEPGKHIPPQDQIAQALNVSRTVVREALSKLEFLNIINVRPKTGTTVNAPSEWKRVNHEIDAWSARARDARDDSCVEK